MISVSTIKSYMFCPLKLYFQSNIDEDVEEDYFISKTLKDLRIDIQDILHKNLRHIKKDMDARSPNLSGSVTGWRKVIIPATQRSSIR